jgi:hypothetical protein
MALISYRRHRFPPVVIQHAVWLYLRFTLSYRDVEELLAERGLDLSYEAFAVGCSNSDRRSLAASRSCTPGATSWDAEPVLAPHHHQRAVWLCKFDSLRS